MSTPRRRSTVRLPARILAAALVALAPGCGTLFGLAFPRGAEVVTRPPGATLYVDGDRVEPKSPAHLGFWPTANHTIEARLVAADGTELKGRTSLNREVRTSVIVLDALFTAGLGLIVDWLTGAMYGFTSDRVVINLAGPVERPPEPAPRFETQPEPREALAPCAICGEPRGDAPVCPHCGLQ